MAKIETHLDIPANLWTIVFGIIFMIVGWFASPIGFGFQALIFLIGIVLVIVGLIRRT